MHGWIIKSCRNIRMLFIVNGLVVGFRPVRDAPNDLNASLETLVYLLTYVRLSYPRDSFTDYISPQLSRNVKWTMELALYPFYISQLYFITFKFHFSKFLHVLLYAIAVQKCVKSISSNYSLGIECWHEKTTLLPFWSTMRFSTSKIN